MYSTHLHIHVDISYVPYTCIYMYNNMQMQFTTYMYIHVYIQSCMYVQCTVYLGSVILSAECKEFIEGPLVLALALQREERENRRVLHLQQVGTQGCVEAPGGGGGVRELAQSHQIILLHWLPRAYLLHTPQTFLCVSDRDFIHSINNNNISTATCTHTNMIYMYVHNVHTYVYIHVHVYPHMYILVQKYVYTNTHYMCMHIPHFLE